MGSAKHTRKSLEAMSYNDLRAAAKAAGVSAAGKAEKIVDWILESQALNEAATRPPAPADRGDDERCGSSVAIYTNAPASYDYHPAKDTGERVPEGTGVGAGNPVREVTVSADTEEEAVRLANYQAERYESGHYFALDRFEYETWLRARTEEG